jgi:hypothetical protein
MRKYALILIRNKPASKTIVKNCMQQYNKNLAWFNKLKGKKHQKIIIKKACHTWLHTRAMALINNRKNQPGLPPSTTLQQSPTQIPQQ